MITTAETNFYTMYELLNGVRPVFNRITNSISNSACAVWGIAHGSSDKETPATEAFIEKIASVLTNKSISFDDIVWATSMNMLKSDYDKLSKFITREYKQKISFEYNKQTLSLMCTNGKTTELFDKPFKYNADIITDNYYIIITGCKENHLTIDAIANLFGQTVPEKREIGSFEYIRNGKTTPRSINQYTFNLYGKPIHVVTGFNVIGGLNGADHKNMIINGIKI